MWLGTGFGAGAKNGLVMGLFCGMGPPFPLFAGGRGYGGLIGGGG